MYTVLKRDGRIISFDIRKITGAIKLAFDAQERNYNDDVIDFLALKVTADFEPKIKDHSISVEDIQDSVEKVLIQAVYDDVAKPTFSTAVSTRRCVTSTPPCWTTSPSWIPTSR